MVDIDTQINHWVKSGQEDWAVAEKLIAERHVRHGLFFAHLALEKLLKAHVCRSTKDLAPKMHNLVRLAELAALTLDKEKLDLLAEMNQFCLEGRYPAHMLPSTSLEEARAYMQRAERVVQCLIQQL
jgi:HEPN domain-containing protein